MRSIQLFLVFSLFSLFAAAQFKTPVVDGVISPGEYGDHSQGKNRGGNWYCTWDDTNIYFAVEGANVNEAAVIYIDTNPVDVVNEGNNSNGSLAGQGYDNTNFSSLPFRANFVTYIKKGYNEYRLSNGSNGWGGNFSNVITMADNGNDVREIVIPWSAMGGRPVAFNFFGFATSGTGYVYNSIPVQNPGANIGTSATVNYYYTVDITDNNSSMSPFSGLSFSTRDQTLSLNNLGEIYDFTASKSTLTFNNNIKIKNRLIVSDAASINIIGSSIALLSSPTKTARIAPVNGSITGNMEVHRYIPAAGKRAWRLLAAPLVASSGSIIRNSWQNYFFQSPYANTGTHITQAGGAATNGFDASTTAYSTSILAYDGTNLFPLLNTNVTKLTENGAAYFLFIRGDRTIDINNNTASSNTVIVTHGQVNTGNVTVGKAGTNYSLIPNPYPSPIDFESVRTGNGSNIDVFYKYDANIKNYRVVERIGSAIYQQTPSQADDSKARYIESGEAFFIAANKQLNFTESMKTGNLPSASVFKNQNISSEISVSLYKEVSGQHNLADGLRIKFDDANDNAVTHSDISKLAGFYENIAIGKDSVLLAVEKRKTPSAVDTVLLKLWNLQTASYRMVFEPSQLGGGDISAMLKDEYLNTLTPVDLTATSVIDFSTDLSIPASFQSDRFKLILTNSQLLPCNFSSVKATGTEEKNVVSWTICRDEDFVAYELQFSADGKNFTVVATIESGKTDGSYSISDALHSGVNAYYRIKAIAKDGNFLYSKIVMVQAAVKTKEIVLLQSNPVIGGKLVLFVNDATTKKLVLSVSNASGQNVLRLNVDAPNNLVQADVSHLAKGVYFLDVLAGESRQQLKFLVD